MTWLVHELWWEYWKMRSTCRSPDDGSFDASRFQKLVQSFMPLLREEILKHKWLESEKAKCDLGQLAIDDWFRKFWWKFCRYRRLEHLEGNTCWHEFSSGDYALLLRVLMEKDLLAEIIDRMKGRVKGQPAHIHDNFEITMWAVGEINVNMQRVQEFLLLIDIDSARLPIPAEWRYTSAV